MNTIESWECRSTTYDAFDQGDMPSRIVGYLADRGFISDDMDVLEIGSGLGTYSSLLAQSCHMLYCLDSSEGMLGRLTDTVRADNMVPILCQWPDFHPGRRFGLCIATLCPGSGSPASIERTESLCEGHNALVFWRHNHGDDPVSDTRRILGMEDPLLNRGRDVTFDWLKNNGRHPEKITFTADVHYSSPVESVVGHVMDEVAGAPQEVVMEAIRPHVRGDLYIRDCTNSLDLLIW